MVENIRVIEEKQILLDGIDWEGLVLELNHLGVRLLETIYFKKRDTYENLPTLQELCAEFKKRYGYSEKTIRRKISFLKKLNLIVIIKTKPVIINPIVGIEKNVSVICTIWNMRDRHAKQN